MTTLSEWRAARASIPDGRFSARELASMREAEREAERWWIARGQAIIDARSSQLAEEIDGLAKRLENLSRAWSVLDEQASHGRLSLSDFRRLASGLVTERQRIPAVIDDAARRRAELDKHSDPIAVAEEWATRFPAMARALPALPDLNV